MRYLNIVLVHNREIILLLLQKFAWLASNVNNLDNFAYLWIIIQSLLDHVELSVSTTGVTPNARSPHPITIVTAYIMIYLQWWYFVEYVNSPRQIVSGVVDYYFLAGVILNLG